MLDLIIKNGSCYIDQDLKNQDIAIKDGKIVTIGKVEEIGRAHVRTPVTSLSRMPSSA